MSILNLFIKKEQAPSKDIAKDRLRLVLIHDRVNCSLQVLEMMKSDIIKVISKYMDIDEGDMDIQISQVKSGQGRGKTTKLQANIPIKRVRRINDANES